MTETTAEEALRALSILQLGRDIGNMQVRELTDYITQSQAQIETLTDQLSLANDGWIKASELHNKSQENYEDALKQIEALTRERDEMKRAVNQHSYAVELCANQAERDLTEITSLRSALEEAMALIKEVADTPYADHYQMATNLEGFKSDASAVYQKLKALSSSPTTPQVSSDTQEGE